MLVLGNGSAVPAPPEARELEAPRVPEPARDDQSLYLHVSLALPTLADLPALRGGLVSSVTQAPVIPGTLVIEYEGLQGYVLKQVQRRYRKMWRDTLKDLDRHSTLSDAAVRTRTESMYWLTADHRAGGRWWERTWMHSLPHEKGGAPTQAFVHRVGRTIEFARVGPIALRNDVRMRVDDITVLSMESGAGHVYRSLDDVGRPARDFAHLDRGSTAFTEPALHEERERSERELLYDPFLAPFHVIDLVLDTELDPSRWLDGVAWRLKFRPGARVNVRGVGVDGLAGDFSMRVVLEVRLGAKGLHVLDLEWKTRYRPSDREMVTGFEVSLLTW